MTRHKIIFFHTFYLNLYKPSSMIYQKIPFLLCVFLYSFVFCKSIEIKNSGNAVQDAEFILLQEKNFKSDSVSLKKYLEPLLHTKNSAHQILYYGLLANGYSNFFDKDNPLSIKYYYQSIRLAQKSKNISLVIWSQLNYFSYRYHYNQYSKMLPVFVAAVREIEKLKPDQIILAQESYKKIAWVMQTIGATDDAIVYFTKAESLLPQDNAEKAALLDNLALCYLKKDEHSKALELLKKANSIAYKVNDSLRVAKTYGNMGHLFLKQNQYEKATEYLKKDIAISEKLGNAKNTMYAYQLLAKTYIAKKDNELAKQYLEKAEKIALSHEYYRSEELEILKIQLSIIPDNYKEELAIRKRISQLEEYVKENDGQEVLNTAQLLVQKTKYEAQIDQVNNNLQEASLHKKIVTVLSAVLLILAFFLYKYFHIKLKKRKKQNDEDLLLSKMEKLNYEKKLTEIELSINTQINLLKDKNKHITALHQEIDALKNNDASNDQEKQDELEKILESHLMTDENWTTFRKAFQKKYPEFYTELHHHFPDLTISNLRVIYLHKLNFNNTEIAGLLGISPDSVKKTKQRLRKKLADKDGVFEQLIIPFYSNN